MKIPTTTVKKGDATKVINTSELETAKAEGWKSVETQDAKVPDNASKPKDKPPVVPAGSAPGSGSAPKTE